MSKIKDAYDKAEGLYHFLEVNFPPDQDGTKDRAMDLAESLYKTLRGLKAAETRERNADNYKVEVKEILAHYNLKRGTRQTDRTGIIAAALKGGFSVDECKAAIDYQHETCPKGSPDGRYFNLVTIFRKKNLERILSYASSPQVTEPKGPTASGSAKITHKSFTK